MAEKIKAKEDHIEKEAKHSYAVLFSILILTFITYIYPVSQSEFLNWDDNIYLTDENAFLSNEAFSNIWIKNKTFNPYPLTFTFLRLELLSFGLNPFKFHLVHLFLHLINISLFWIVLRKIQVQGFALWVSLGIYALHPVQVESVIWVSEVKNLLSALFYWISFLFLIKFFENKKYWHYGIGVCTFILSLLSKSMTVTLPVSLTLWAFLFHRAEIKKKILWLIPLWGISFLFGILSIQSEDRYYDPRHDTILKRSALVRLHDVTEATCFYVWKIIYPKDLIAIYPQNPLITPKTIASYLSIGGLFLFVFFLFYCAAKVKDKRIPFALLNYGIVAGPILGLFSTSYMHLSKVADRYHYHPLPFLALGVGLLLQQGWSKLSAKQRDWSGFMAGILLFGLCYFCFQYAMIWTNSIRLWSHVIEVSPKQQAAYTNLGLALLEKNDFPVAKICLEKSVELDPSDGKSWHNLGFIYSQEKNYSKAIYCFEKARKAKKPYQRGIIRLGEIYLKFKRIDLARDCFEEALELADKKENYYLELRKENAYLGLVLCHRDQYEKATKALKELFKINETWLPAYHLSYDIYQKHQKLEVVIAILEQGLKIAPENVLLKLNLAHSLIACEPKFRNPSRALMLIESLSAIKPKTIVHHQRAALVFQATGNASKALKNIKRAIFLAEEQKNVSKEKLEELKEDLNLIRAGVPSSHKEK